VLAGAIADLIPLIQREGIKVVVDIDDHFRHTPPRMGGRLRIQPELNPHYNWRHMVTACAHADLVTCSTPALRAYAPHGRVRLIRNRVPERFLQIMAPRDGQTVGWSGDVSQHPGDLEVTRGGVGQALAEADADFMVVGTRLGVRDALELPAEPYATGHVSHEDYIRKLAELDVGIAPLADNSYTRAKSSIRLLQYMALGIPWIASPSPEHELLHDECAMRHSPASGAIARSRRRDWCREVSKALRRPESERQAISEQSRQLVADHYTIEANADEWLNAWASVVEGRVATVA
jgi:glycosyltransferase involved in cell wall biosynthesis